MQKSQHTDNGGEIVLSYVKLRGTEGGGPTYFNAIDFLWVVV